jgi:hypothetical protein
MNATDRKNRLSSPMTKEEIFTFIDSYFAEDRANIEFEVPPDEIRSAVAKDLDETRAAVNKQSEALRAILPVLDKAATDARVALETAQRKTGGEFTVKIERKDAPTVTVKNPHKQFAELLQILSAGCNAYLVGPAGSGKSTAAAQCAEALGLSFHFTGAVLSEFKLTGFIDAGGTYRSTEFRRAYENGGVFLFDEIDASSAQAVLCFNAALANGVMDFPDKTVKMHADFRCIAAANTYGQGATREYVGRNQLDAASLDRFVFVLWNYDEDLELRIAGNAAWVSFVQSVRKACETLKVRAVVSPRASMFGAKLLAAGMDRAQVEALTIWKGIEAATVQKIRASL